MNCKILNNINLLSNFKDKDYKFILVDTNSLTIVPYLNSEKYMSTDRIIISPFMETFKFFLNYKKIFPEARFVFTFDTGISPIITNIMPSYKKNRKSRRYTASSSTFTTGALVYDYNIKLLSTLFTYFNEYVIFDLNRNEADFIIGYLVDDLSTIGKCLVMSHDKDLLLTFNKNENVDVVYKQTGTKDAKVTNYFVDTQDCVNHIIDFQYLQNTKDLLYYRALCGDVSDNIPKPFGLKSKVIVNNMFKDCFMMDIKINYDYIVCYFKEKFKSMNPVVFEKFEEDFRKNIAIMNVFNKEIISDNEKIKLNHHLDEIKFNLNNKIEINSIYDLFDKYGLYLSKEDLDKTFEYLKGI